MRKVKLEEVKRTAWAACDTFRGVMDAADYKDYVLVFLFLKYVSDTWKEHLAEMQKRYPGDKERIRRRMERERFLVPEHQTFDDIYAHRGAPNIGERINVALTAIEDANKAKLDGVFRGVDFNSETKLGNTKDRSRRLKNLIEDFAKLDLSPSRVDEDVIGETYIYLIERFAMGAGKKSGEFYTPKQLSRLLAKLAQVKPGDRIADPACGSGSLLIRAAEEIEAQGSKDYALFGQEPNGATWSLARMNMFLHGKDGARLEWGDTLNEPKLIEKDKLLRFDAVVANPPFSLDKWGAEHSASDRFGRFWRGVPPKSKADWAFITHMVETAREREGRVAVIVPHGVLFRGGGEGAIRKAMIEENLLDAVVALPANLFPTTGIPVAMLVFDRRREVGGALADRHDVIFIDASHEYREGKKQNALEDEHVDKIVATHRARTDVVAYARIVQIAEIAENDHNLNIPRYVDRSTKEGEIDISAVEAEIEALETELIQVRKEMKRHLKELGL